MQTTISGPMMYDFKTRALVPVDPGDLPRGTLVTYEDSANPRRRYVITGPAQPGSHGQPCTSETGGRSHVSKSALDGPGGWARVNSPPLDEAAVLAFLEAAAATRARLDREATDRAAREASEHASAVSALRRDHPALELAEGSKKSGHALAAANIRKLLRQAFPGHKFSVTSESYSMGNAVRIGWDDGPTSDEVEAIAKPFCNSWFDGMDDSSHCVRSPWHIFGSAKHVSCSRHLSREAYAAAALKFLADTPERAALAAELAEDITQGRAWQNDLAEMAQREAHARSFYTPPAPAPIAPPRPATPGTDPGSNPATVSANEELGGVEIRFPAKPSPDTLAALKAAGWRWSRRSACWYKRQGPGVMEEAGTLSNN